MDLYGTAREVHEVARDCKRWNNPDAPPTKEELRERLQIIRACISRAETSLETELEVNKVWKDANPNSEPEGFLFELGCIVSECFDVSVAIEGDIEHAINVKLEWDKEA